VSKSPLKKLLWTVPLFLAFNACNPPTFPKGRLTEAVKDLCRREQKLEVEAHLAGKTLYISCRVEGLIGQNLDFQKDALAKLEGVMLSGTRASLSTDATVDFLEIRVHDARLGSAITLLRYVPDIKGLIFMKYSRGDFEDRLVLETNVGSPVDPLAFHDVSMMEFLARLVASQLQQKITRNPLVSVFLQIQEIQGRVDNGLLVLTLLRSTTVPVTGHTLSVLEVAVTDVAKAALKKYDRGGRWVKGVVIKDKDGTEISRFPISPK